MSLPWFDARVEKDWVRWHRDYDQPGSSLARRLKVVQHELDCALSAAQPDGGELQLISMCAGDGRDVLPVLVARDAPVVRALLVELDVGLADRARATAAQLGLPSVEVVTADAGCADVYVDVAPAHVVLACGVFGNISLDDTRRTVAALPSLLAPGGVVIWTRGRGEDDIDPIQRIRELFAERGYTEVSYAAPHDARFRVGSHRLASPLADLRPLSNGLRMFTFS